MKRTSFENMQCPAAQALECVGEWWSILILRDAFHGLTRFDEFQSSLGIAPNILTRRLKHLTERALMERRIYNQHPPRYEYVLTEKGRDFFPVLVMLVEWSNRNLASEGVAVQLIDRASGRPIAPILVDRRNNSSPISLDNVILQAGPAANASIRERVAYIESQSPQPASGSAKEVQQ